MVGRDVDVAASRGKLAGPDRRGKPVLDLAPVQRAPEVPIIRKELGKDETDIRTAVGKGTEGVEDVRGRTGNKGAIDRVCIVEIARTDLHVVHLAHGDKGELGTVRDGKTYVSQDIRPLGVGKPDEGVDGNEDKDGNEEDVSADLCPHDSHPDQDPLKYSQQSQCTYPIPRGDTLDTPERREGHQHGYPTHHRTAEE